MTLVSQDSQPWWGERKVIPPDQDTHGVTAQILLGADQATLFPHSVKDSTGTLIQVDQARLMQSEITRKYIVFGSGRRHSRHTEDRNPGIRSTQFLYPKRRNKLELWVFKSPNFGFKDAPSLAAAGKKSMGEFYRSYFPEDKYKLNPADIKQAEVYLERAFSDDFSVTGFPPMVGERKVIPPSNTLLIGAS